MKIKSLIAAFAAIIFTCTSCGVTGSTSSTANPTKNGTSVGTALLGLYTQYKTDGKLDLSNVTNLANLATIANNIGGLKDTASSTASSFLDLFKSGLIKGSTNLVNNANADSVINILTKLSNTDLSSLTKAAAGAATGISTISNASKDVSTAVNSVTSILNMFKK